MDRVADALLFASLWVLILIAWDVSKIRKGE
jgi:hypothetical protein